MSSAVEFWIPTQLALQSTDEPLVDKPRLTDKLLSKPPFRFLHDVITAVQNKTGFAPGLFAGQELDGHAIQDKEGKVAYLNKIIAVVCMALGQTVPAKPAKIVAGLEPENTNVFLQMLAKAAQMGDAADIVQIVLAGQGPVSSAQHTASSSGVTQQHQIAPGPGQPAVQQQQQLQTALGKSGSGSRHTYSEATAGTGDQAAQGQVVPTQQLLQQYEAATLERPHSRRLSRDTSNRQQQQQHEEMQQLPQRALPQETAAGGHVATSYKMQQQPAAVELRPPSSSSSRIMSARKPPPLLASSGTSPIKPNSPQAALAARPASGLRSAGRTPPAGADTHSGLARPPSAGIPAGSSSSSSSRDAAAQKKGAGARIGQRPIGTLLRDEGSSSDDDGPVQDLLADGVLGTSQWAPRLDAAVAGAQGVLVKDILTAEEQLKRAGADAAAAAAGDQEDISTGIILKRQAKPTGSTSRKPRDLAALADAVQKLCQVALPLARSLEFLHEDVESMSKEYRFWVTERRVYQERLLEEQKAAADTSDLAARVAEQDSAIRAAKARISALRSQVLHGEEQIDKLLQTVVAGSR